MTPDPYDYGAHLRRRCIQEMESAEHRYQRSLSRLTSPGGPLQKAILRDHPKRAVRRHPSGLISPPPTLTPRWVGIVAQRASQALGRVCGGMIDTVRSLGRLRVTRGPLGHRKEEHQ